MPIPLDGQALTSSLVVAKGQAGEQQGDTEGGQNGLSGVAMDQVRHVQIPSLSRKSRTFRDAIPKCIARLLGDLNRLLNRIIRSSEQLLRHFARVVKGIVWYFTVHTFILSRIPRSTKGQIAQRRD